MHLPLSLLVKKLIASGMVLTHYDPDLEQPLKLACDASSVRDKAVLSYVMEDGSE